MPPDLPPPPENFAQTPGGRLQYRARGDGAPLVLVHGLLGSSFSWRRNLEPLACDFRVCALDLIGLGLSGRPRDYLYSFSTVAEQIHEFAGAVAAREIFLVGHSTGGAAALLCAARHPELVSKLVLLAPANPFSGRGRRLIRLGGSPLLGNLLLHLGRLLANPLAGFLLRHRLYGDPKMVDGETIAGYVTPLARPELVYLLRRALAAWDMEVVRAALPAVRQPVLLIWGDRDRVVPLASAAPLAAALRARLEVIPGCGHLVSEEAPEAVNRLIRTFLTGTPAATSARVLQ